MDTNKLNHFKTKLEEEKRLLEEELSTVATRNPQNPTDWEPKYTTEDVDKAEYGDVADAIEETENNIGILHNLEIKYTEVIKALSKIDAGTFGICEVGGEHIEEARLEANPSATTCKHCMNS